MSRRRIALLPRFCGERHTAESLDAFTLRITCPNRHIFQTKAGKRYYCQQCGTAYSVEDCRLPLTAGQNLEKPTKSRKRQDCSDYRGGRLQKLLRRMRQLEQTENGKK